MINNDKINTLLEKYLNISDTNIEISNNEDLIAFNYVYNFIHYIQKHSSVSIKVIQSSDINIIGLELVCLLDCSKYWIKFNFSNKLHYDLSIYCLSIKINSELISYIHKYSSMEDTKESFENKAFLDPIGTIIAKLKAASVDYSISFNCDTLSHTIKVNNENLFEVIDNGTILYFYTADPLLKEIKRIIADKPDEIDLEIKNFIMYMRRSVKFDFKSEVVSKEAGKITSKEKIVVLTMDESTINRSAPLITEIMFSEINNKVSITFNGTNRCIFSPRDVSFLNSIYKYIYTVFDDSSSL